jgi:pyruvate formate lyase activating enzyme
MDIKLADENEHIRYTGVSNALIKENAKWLMKSGTPHVFRVPLIPGITDTVSNLTAISEFLGDESVELLPYNKLAAAKYGNVGLEFTDKILEDRKNDDPVSYFKNAVMRK